MLRCQQRMFSLRCLCCVGRGRPPWKNPTIFQQGNILKPHTRLRMYENANEGMKDKDINGGGFPFASTIRPDLRQFITSKWETSLDGSWNFKLYPNPASLKGGMPGEVPDLVQLFPDIQHGECVKFHEAIQVPGCWEMQGYDYPIYTNIQYPWLTGKHSMTGGNILAGYHAGNVPDHNPTGLYRRTFKLSKEWCIAVEKKERRIIIHFGAVSSACRVFMNGMEVGYFQDSFTETEVDVTEAILQRGVRNEHVIGLQVMRFSDGSWLEDQDHWWLSGVHRSIFLQARPRNNLIADYTVRTEVGKSPKWSSSGSTCSSTLSVEVELHSTTESTTEFTLYDDKLNIIANCILANSSSKDVTNESVAMKVDQPKLWTAETPNLYTLTIATDQQCEMVRVGFRDCRVSTMVSTMNGEEREKGEKDKQEYFLLNGKPLVIAGVNYHEHDTNTGKTLSSDSYAHDLWLMKSANFNAVRCCHYPHDHRFYELCNEMGLYVCDEANIETHGFALIQQISYLTCHPDWTSSFVSRVMTMVHRAKNYPCIITWSLGNESGYGPNHEAAASQLRAYDSTRPLQYEGGRKNGDAVLLMGTGHGPRTITDFICPMYHSPAELAIVARNFKETRPIVSCEYLHAMGNSTGMNFFMELLFSSFLQNTMFLLNDCFCLYHENIYILFNLTYIQLSSWNTLFFYFF